MKSAAWWRAVVVAAAVAAADVYILSGSRLLLLSGYITWLSCYSFTFCWDGWNCWSGHCRSGQWRRISDIAQLDNARVTISESVYAVSKDGRDFHRDKLSSCST